MPWDFQLDENVKRQIFAYKLEGTSQSFIEKAM